MSFFRSVQKLLTDCGSGAIDRLVNRSVDTEDTERVSKKKSAFFNCIGRNQDKHGGYLYRFKLKEKYNYFLMPEDKEKWMAAISKTEEISPAIENNLPFLRLLVHPFTPDKWLQKIVNDTLESSWERYVFSDSSDKSELRAVAKLLPLVLQLQISGLDTEMDGFAYFLAVRNICLDAIKKGTLTAQSLYGRDEIIKSYEYSKQRHNIFYKLGYRIHIDGDGDFTLTLPNKNAFTARWVRLQSEYKSLNLPSIDIKSAKGVATDQQYILSFLLSDVLLSSGREFIHDHLFHVERLVYLIFSNDDPELDHFQRYIKEKGRVRGIIREVQAVITRARAMIASGELSFLVYMNEVAERRGEGRPVTIDDLLPIEYILGTITDSVASFNQYEGTNIPGYSILDRTEIFNFIGFSLEDDDILSEWDKKWDGNQEMQRLANPYRLSTIWQEITSHIDLQKVHIISSNDEQDSPLSLTMF